MKIILYKNKAESIRMNKADYLEEPLEMTGSLRQQTSITNPNIIIESKENKLLEYNYMFIEEFKRYYFISDITSINTYLWLVSCTEDVLMSFKSQIENLTPFISRNEFTYDNSIEDTKYLFKYNKDIKEYIPVEGSRVNVQFRDGIKDKNNPLNIAISVINDKAESIALSDTNAPNDVLDNINASATNLRQVSQLVCLPETTLINLIWNSYSDSSVSTYINSCVIFPFELVDRNNLVGEELYIGSNSAFQGESFKIRDKIGAYKCLANFVVKSENQNFLDYEPYSVYEIYIPYVGWKTLNASMILDHELALYYSIDYLTGESMVNLVDITGDKLVLSCPAQLGVKISFSTSNNEELLRTKISTLMSSSLGALTNPLVASAKGLPYTPLNEVVNVGSKSLSWIDRGQVSVVGGDLSLSTPQDVRIRITRNIELLESQEEILKFNHTFGKPLDKFKLIKSLSGYTEVAEVHMENFKNVLESEKTSIERILKSGFII